MANNVVFRRIGGRVVPIKQGGSRDGHVRKGVALIGAGMGVGTGAGIVSAGLSRSAAEHENVARTVQKMAGKARKSAGVFGVRSAQRTFHIAAKNKIEATRFASSAQKIKQGGAAAGSALIGIGVHKALEKTKLSETQKSTIATGAGIGAYAATRAAFTRTIGKTSTKFAIKHAFQRLLVRGFKL